MLLELSITDFAIIEHLDVDFQKGMTVLTGETGAGKSIIIDAVSLLAGGRGSHDLIRSGANKAILQGHFRLSANSYTYNILDELGIDHTDGDIIIERSIFKNGRNSCRINGILVNITNLKRVGETIVDIQGQNEHQELMNSDYHINLLDNFAGSKIENLMTEYELKYRQYLKLKKKIADKRSNEKEWAQRMDMLKFQIDEIERAELSEDEDNELEDEKNRLVNFQKIHTTLMNGFQNINGGEIGSSLDQIGLAMSALQSIENLDPAFKQISDELSTSFYALQDASNEISDQLTTLEFDQERLEYVDQRLNLIRNLKLKYGDSISQILDYLDQIKGELDEMAVFQSNGDDLEQQLLDEEKKLILLADQLTAVRKQSIVSLEKVVQQQLADLYMEKAVFEVRINELPQFTTNGKDRVEFYIQTNPGEKMLPLVKSASGGELSRIMLALKTIFARASGVTSVIFDEVDTGVSGRVAQAIGNKIFTISTKSQVLCITHLPQVAAMSDQHYLIKKEVINDRTKTQMILLDFKQKVNEIARMLAGTQVTKITKTHAEELLELAEKEKNEIRKNKKTDN